MKNIEKLIEEKSVLIESLQKIINESQEIMNEEAIEKLVNDKTNLVTMKKCLAEKDSYIVNLENKVKDMDSNFEAQHLKIKNLKAILIFLL